MTAFVTTRVKSALLNEEAIKSHDIAVVTRKGEVQLSGFVDNQLQIDRALVVTRSVEGAVTVDNEMSIKKMFRWSSASIKKRLLLVSTVSALHGTANSFFTYAEKVAKCTSQTFGGIRIGLFVFDSVFEVFFEIAKRSLDFSCGILNFSLQLQIFVANCLTGNFLDCALGFFDAAFDLIFVHDLIL